MSRWAKQFSRVGRDGLQLARAIFRDSTTKRAVSFKPSLLDQARQSNSVAYSLLRMDRQIGVVRYYGIMGYFRQQWQARFTSSLPPSTTSEDNNDGNVPVSSPTSTASGAANTASEPTKARIAFMITASMKSELIEKLGYDMDQHIKKMTPLQASLILHRRITAEEMEEELPSAEEEYQKQLEEDAVRQQKEAEAQETLRAQQLAAMKKAEALEKAQGAASGEISADAKNQQDTQSASPPLYETMDGTPDGFQPSDSLLSSSASDSQSGFGNSWFEVIETNPETGETSRVGLYLDENEATLGFQTRQEIAERNETGLTFELRPIDKSDILS